MSVSVVVTKRVLFRTVNHAGTFAFGTDTRHEIASRMQPRLLIFGNFTNFPYVKFQHVKISVVSNHGRFG